MVRFNITQNNTLFKILIIILLENLKIKYIIQKII